MRERGEGRAPVNSRAVAAERRWLKSGGGCRAAVAAERRWLRLGLQQAACGFGLPWHCHVALPRGTYARIGPLVRTHSRIQEEARLVGVATRAKVSLPATSSQEEER